MILFDDILHTGRTIRAAMNEIFDYRAGLCNSGGSFRSRRKRLPISPDISGINMQLSDKYHVKIENNASLEFKVFERQNEKKKTY